MKAFVVFYIALIISSGFKFLTIFWQVMTYLFSVRGSLENCRVWGRVGQPFFLGPGQGGAGRAPLTFIFSEAEEVKVIFFEVHTPPTCFSLIAQSRLS